MTMVQTTITFPSLDDEVPALYLDDGKSYILVFAYATPYSSSDQTLQ
ncbi:MAG TPA: hypothetical protein VJ761_07520 [Ktedonobacteraceae bacterium]|nr:hypothetical protein [Ktedonobacteraceae bacterium]